MYPNTRHAEGLRRARQQIAKLSRQNLPPLVSIQLNQLLATIRWHEAELAKMTREDDD